MKKNQYIGYYYNFIATLFKIAVEKEWAWETEWASLVSI